MKVHEMQIGGINFMSIMKTVNTVLDKGYKLVLLQKEKAQKILQ